MRLTLLLSSLFASTAVFAQGTPSLSLSGGTYTLTIPYLEAPGGTPAYSARLTATQLAEFLLDAASIKQVSTVAGSGSRPSYSSSGGVLRLTLPSLQFVNGDTTLSYSATLSSSNGSSFKVEQATAGPAWGAAGGSCRPVTYDSTAQTVLSGALKVEFEDISQAEGMLHVRFTNVSANTLYLSLDVSSNDGRVGLMAPQSQTLYLSAGESLVGYVLYYGTGATGPASYKTKFSFAGIDTATGKPTSASDSFERTVNFVRPTETALTITDAASQLSYTRTSQVTAKVGFWRNKVDAAETRIVLFPGQENWTDASAAAQSKLLAYTLDGSLLWEYASGTEVWGGDASADGKYVAYATVASTGVPSKLVLLDAAKGTLLKELTLSAGGLPTPANAMAPTRGEMDAREVRFSADGSLLAVGTAEGRAYVFDTTTLTARYALQTEGQVRAAEFKGDYLYWGSGDGLLYKTKVADGSVVWKSYTTAWPYSEPTFSVDGKRMVVGTKSGGFTVLDTETGACQFSANYGTVRQAFFTPDGKHVVAATGAMTAGTIGYRLSDWGVAWRGPMSAAASVTADGRYVFSADGKGAIMDTSTGQRVATLDGGFSSNASYFKTAYISKDGSRAVIARRDLTPGDVAIAFFKRQ